MSVKNVLVLKNYIIKNKTSDPLAPNARGTYLKMEKIVIEHAFRFVPNLHDVIVDSKEVDTAQEMFKDHMLCCFQHWNFLNPRNILYCDLDTMFVNYCNVFITPDIEDFYMPGDTCGVRYYPRTMSSKVWDLMFEEYNKWDTSTSHWSYEEEIYRKMKQLSGVESSAIVVAEVPSNLPMSSYESPPNANVLHLHATRNPADALKSMQFMQGNIKKKFV